MDTSGKLGQNRGMRPSPSYSPASWTTLQSAVEGCERCPRLRKHCQETAREKRKAYRDQNYWGRPVSGFGDTQAELWILGLAPGAHGANRTGRVFTGDRSGEWLYRALFEAGFASAPESIAPNDGLTLKNAYISCIARCAPPQNKPTPKEIQNCSDYLQEEKRLLSPRLKVVLCLGAMAYKEACRLYAVKATPCFSHGLVRPISREVYLLCSYHPSQQNTFTGKLQWHAWTAVFAKARELISSGSKS